MVDQMDDWGAYPGISQDGITSTLANIPNGASVVTLAAAVHTVTIQLSPGSSPLNVHMGDTNASQVGASSYQIPPGGSYTYKGRMVQKFSVWGPASPTGTYSVQAN